MWNNPDFFPRKFTRQITYPIDLVSSTWLLEQCDVVQGRQIFFRGLSCHTSVCKWYSAHARLWNSAVGIAWKQELCHCTIRLSCPHWMWRQHSHTFTGLTHTPADTQPRWGSQLELLSEGPNRNDHKENVKKRNGSWEEGSLPQHRRARLGWDQWMKKISQLCVCLVC